MSDLGKRIVLTVDQARSMLAEEGAIHTFRSGGRLCLVGADWEREEILKAIDECECELGGPQCQAMNHGLVIHTDGPLFVECKDGFDYAAFESSLNGNA